LLLQANLLAQCATALLVAASASWIRVSELRYRQVVVHNPVVIYSARVHRPGVVGRPGVEVTLVSAASDGLLGCPPEDLLGDFDRWLERVHEDDRVVVRAALTQLERQTEPVVCEYRLAPTTTANGVAAEAWNLESDAVRAVAAAAPGARAAAPAKVRWVRDTLAPNFDADGRLCGWEGVLIEVTGQRALADDLRRTTSLFHALVASLPAGVFFVQGTRARPILVNARARQLLGQREDVAAGLEHLSDVYRLHRLDGSPYPVEELPVVRALRRGLTTLSADVVVHRPDGRRMTLMSWAAPVALEGPGAAPAAVWVFEDLKLLHSAEATGREGGAAVSRNG
jgi:PAS domain-containing protein